MNTPIHVHTFQLDPAQRQQLKQAHEALQRSIESTGSLQAALFEHLKPLMRSALDSQPGLLELLKDAEFNKHLLHLCDDDTDLLNLPWRLATDYLPLLCLSKGIANGTCTLPAFTPEIAPPLKILVMISAPEDANFAHRLDYETEEARIIAAFKNLYESANVEIHFTEDGSLESLERALRDNDYHALHFSGHGAYQNGQGYLQLEDPVTNRSSLATAEQFAQSLKAGNTAPALVLLSSCQTAQGMVQGTEFLGVANRLLQANIPGVIAMGFSIRDDYATLFAAGFYEALSKRKNVWEAFHLAVAAMQKAEEKDPRLPRPAQYMIPQLYCSHACEQLTDWSLAKKGLTFSAWKFVAGEQRLLLEQQPGYLFIGRRRERREAFARLLERKPVHLKGAGGVGKTALSEHLVQRLIVRKPDERREIYPFVFNETTTNLQGILDAFQKYLQGEKRQWLIRSETEKFEKNTDKLLFLLGKLDEACLPVFVFDNLESFQDGKGVSRELGDGGFKGEYAELAETLHFLCETQAYHLLLTGRYPLDFPNLGEAVNLNTVALGDFFRKCHQLSLWELNDLLHKREQERLNKPPENPSDEKAPAELPVKPLAFEDVIRLLHRTFGGNYRALEFFDTLYQQRKADILPTLGRLEDLEKRMLEHEKGEVLARLQEGAKSLVFDELLGLLTEDERQALQLLAGFRIPVLPLALDMQGTDETTPLLERLTDLTLAERRREPEFGLEFFYVPPIVKDLLADVPPNRSSEVQAFSDMRAGDYYWFVKKEIYKKSVADLEEAFSHYHRAGAVEQVNDIGGTLSNFYYGFSAFQTAVFYALATEALVREKTNGLVLTVLGLIYQLYGHLEKSLVCFEKCLPIFQNDGNRQGKAATLNNISHIYHTKGNYDMALKCLQQSLQIQQEIGDRQGEGQSLNNISQIYYAKGDYDTTLKYLQQSLKIRQKIGDQQGEGVTLNNIGQSHKAQGDYDTSLKYFLQSLKITQEIGNLQVEGTILNNIGNIHHTKGDYDMALRYFQLSLKITQEIGDRQSEGRNLNNISQIHSAKGEYDMAMKYLQQSLKITQEIGDQQGMGATLHNIGQIHSNKGDYDTALQYLEQSLKIRQEIGDISGMAITLTCIGLLLLKQQQLEEAVPLLIQAYNIFKQIGSPNVQAPASHLNTIKERIGQERFNQILAAAQKSTQ